MTDQDAAKIIELLKQILRELEEFHASFDKAS
jgi:hypothetical protein